MNIDKNKSDFYMNNGNFYIDSPREDDSPIHGEESDTLIDKKITYSPQQTFLDKIKNSLIPGYKKNCLIEWGIDKEIVDKIVKDKLTKDVYQYLFENSNTIPDRVKKINKLKDVHLILESRTPSKELYNTSQNELLNHVIDRENSENCRDFLNIILEGHKILNIIRKFKTDSGKPFFGEENMYISHTENKAEHSFFLNINGKILIPHEIIYEKKQNRKTFKVIAKTMNAETGNQDEILMKFHNSGKSPYIEKKINDEIKNLKILNKLNLSYIVDDFSGIAREQTLIVGVQKKFLPLDSFFEQSPTIDALLLIVSQMTIGATGMNRYGIVHGDLKSNNCLINEDYNKISIIDFGFTQLLEKGIKSKLSLGGTLNYSAPELLEKTPMASILSDSYSLGVIFIEVVLKFAKLDQKISLSDIYPSLYCAQSITDQFVLGIFEKLSELEFSEKELRILSELLLISLDLLLVREECELNESMLNILKDREVLLAEVLKKIFPKKTDNELFNLIHNHGKIEKSEKMLKPEKMHRISSEEAAKQLRILIPKICPDIYYDIDWKILDIDQKELNSKLHKILLEVEEEEEKYINEKWIRTSQERGSLEFDYEDEFFESFEKELESVEEDSEEF